MRCKFCSDFILRGSDTCLSCAKKILAGETLHLVGTSKKVAKAGGNPKPRKKAAANITSLTMEECRRLGWLVEKCEYWLASHIAQQIVSQVRMLEQQGPAADWAGVLRPLAQAVRKNPGVRKDIFGFIDALAITPKGILAIQSTTIENISARTTKIRDEHNATAVRWLESGNALEVWGWEKQERPAENGRYWQVVRREITMPMLSVPLPF